MKAKIWLLVLFALAPMLTLRAQVVIVAPPGDYDNLKDSIMQHYYPGMYDSKNWGNPLVPSPFFFKYNSPLNKLETPRDTILCVVQIFLNEFSDGMKVGIRKGYRHKVGSVWLDIKDRTYPTIDSAQIHEVRYNFKRIRKHYKFKLRKYILCEPPEYPQKEVKRITTYISYSPYAPGQTKIVVWADHFPYGSKKRHVAYTKEKAAKQRAREDKEYRKEKDFNYRQYVRDLYKFKYKKEKNDIMEKVFERKIQMDIDDWASHTSQENVERSIRENKEAAKAARQKAKELYRQRIRSGYFNKTVRASQQD